MKMSIKLYKYIPYILLFVLTTNCKKYLDTKSSSALATPSTLPDLQRLLDNANVMNISLTPSYGEASADDYFLLPSSLTGLVTQQQDVYKWIAYDYSYPNDWSKSYLPVYNANLCLESLEKITRTDANRSEWDNIKGSALFYRAYNFLHLTWTFAHSYDNNNPSNLGIALRLNSDFNIPSKRSTVIETYDRIISDTKESINYLPDYPLYVTRPSKSASYALLARSYLSMNNYDSALKYADLCLTLKSDLLNYNTTPVPFPKFNNPETIFYSELNGNYSTFATSRALIDTTLYRSYLLNDSRRSKLFTAGINGYSKYRGSYSGSTSSFFSGLATNEVFLVKSECLARKGDKDAALSTLNLLLAKRFNAPFTDLTASDAPEAVNTILLERRKELIFRGLRWIEIKRLNRINGNIIPKRNINGQILSLQPNSNYYALPLPYDIITLTDMPQNPK